MGHSTVSKQKICAYVLLWNELEIHNSKARCNVMRFGVK